MMQSGFWAHIEEFTQDKQGNALKFSHNLALIQRRYSIYPG